MVAVAEVVFLDVGQGTANAILIGGRKAILVDVGPRPREILGLLDHYGIESLPQVYLSHSDGDHSGAAAAVLENFEGRVGEIFLAQDAKLYRKPFWDCIRRQLKRETLREPQINRFEAFSPEPRETYRDINSGLRIGVLAPLPGAVIHATGREKTNEASGIAFLRTDRGRIIFSGDASVDSFRPVIAARGGKPLRCDIFVVPHHGGVFHKSQADLDWLLDSAVKTDVAIVSVGTVNIRFGYGHPRQEVVHSLATRGVTAMCTQLTSQCCNPADMEDARRLSPKLPAYGASLNARSVTKTGYSRDVACVGTIVAEVSRNGVVLPEIAVHQPKVDSLPRRPGVGPLCRLLAARAGGSSTPRK